MVRNDQTTFWAHLSATERRAAPPRPGAGPGHATVSRVVVTDMTVHRREEEQQLKIEALLHQTQKLKTLGVLAGGMAHDFNNLLATIVGNANLASIGPGRPADRKDSRRMPRPG